MSLNLETIIFNFITMNSLEETKTESISEEKKEVLLSELEINDPNTALNVIISFINLANKRGAFDVKESAKIWECIQQFQKKMKKITYHKYICYLINILVMK